MRLLMTLVWLAVGALVQVRGEAPLAEFPVQYRGGLLWLQVSVAQSAEPLHFLLDSGANVSVINLTTARRLGLKPGRAVNVQAVGATTQGYWPQRLEAKAGGVTLPRDYLAIDLGDLSRACDCALDGLLGADFFREHMVQIDFAAQRVRLLKPGRQPLGGEILPLETGRGVLRVPIRVNGQKPQWVRLDTGCASPLQWVTSQVEPQECTHQVAVALTQLSIATTRVQVQFGCTQFSAVPAGLHEGALFAGEAGLLGNGLLSRFDSVTIDTKGRRLILQNATGANTTSASH